MAENFENKIIKVCGSCGRSCCWYGEFMCEDCHEADLIKKTVAELRLEDNGEHERYWSDKTMTDVYGEPAPFGYKKEV